MGKRPAIVKRISIRLVVYEASVHCIAVLLVIRLAANVAWLNWFMLRRPMVWLEGSVWGRTTHDKGVS